MKNVTNFSSSTSYKTYDDGLRKYMTSIFKYMFFALGLTGVVAFVVSNSPQLLRFVASFHIIFSLAPLFFVIYFSSKIWTMSPERARNNLWIYSVLMGISLSFIFLAYSGISIAKTFLFSATTFAGMALYGNTTKKDLTSMGSFMIMGLFGILIASLVNIFLKSSAIEFATSILGIIIFTGLTAYDVQRLKETYNYVGINADATEKVAIIGALNLYMDFINLFIHLLRFFGERK
ncbi:MAG: Bax inhibitor-1/YccA family protein [Rickettsiales bacterium]|jgi:FtsH-binding integral membrane protein|nr:Bax inhibitor-1/YccA family protein [Rickettsiales bacterium]